MALDPNINRIKFTRSKVAGKKPTTAQIQEGELAINLVDRMLYTNDGTSIVDLGFSQGGPVNGNIDVKGNITATGTVKAPTFIGNLNGNADTATKLKSPAKINNVDFDGSKDIVITDDTKLAISNKMYTTQFLNTPGRTEVGTTNIRDVASITAQGSPFTAEQGLGGVAVIHLPTTRHSNATMFRMIIQGYNYSSGAADNGIQMGWTVELTGYNYQNSNVHKWHAMRATSTSGKCPFDRVTFGQASDHNVIILGNLALTAAENGGTARVATRWSYPMIQISEMLIKMGDSSNEWLKTTIAWETSLAPYVIEPDAVVFVKGVEQALRLTDERTITFQGDTTGSFKFDGSQNATATLTTRQSTVAQSGIVQLSDSLDSALLTTAATSNTVKRLNDALWDIGAYRPSTARGNMIGSTDAPYQSANQATRNGFWSLGASAKDTWAGQSSGDVLIGGFWGNTNGVQIGGSQSKNGLFVRACNATKWQPWEKVFSESDTIDLLTSVNKTFPLSANQGRELKLNAFKHAFSQDTQYVTAANQVTWKSYNEIPAGTRVLIGSTLLNNRPDVDKMSSGATKPAYYYVETILTFREGTDSGRVQTVYSYFGNASAIATGVKAKVAVRTASSDNFYSDWTYMMSDDMATTGNSGSATKLETARLINGTSFDGTGNITTAQWGLNRSITIGKHAQNVNGGANYSWSLAQMGAVDKAGDTMTGALTVNGNLTTGGTLSISGARILSPSRISVLNGSAQQGLTVGSIAVGLNYANANTEVEKLPIGSVYVNATARVGTLIADNNTTLNGTLTVTGITTLNGNTLTNGLTVRQNLGVAGTADIVGKATVTGDIATLNNVTAAVNMTAGGVISAGTRNGVKDTNYNRIQILPPVHSGVWNFSTGDSGNTAYMNIGYNNDVMFTLGNDGNGASVTATKPLFAQEGIGVMMMSKPASAKSGIGISLYGNDVGGNGRLPAYGMAFAKTADYGPLGHVTGDWATYFTMQGGKNRGWIFRNDTNDNIMSINAYGEVMAQGGFYINSAPGGFANNFIKQGTGDAANYDTYNLAIGSHNGIGFVDRNGAANMVMDVRAGNFSARGTITAYDLLATHDIKATGWIYAPKFIGNLQGKADNAALADRAINADGAVVAGRADSLAVALDASKRLAIVAHYAGLNFPENNRRPLYYSNPNEIYFVIEKSDLGSPFQIIPGESVVMFHGEGHSNNLVYLTQTINAVTDHNATQYRIWVNWPNHGIPNDTPWPISGITFFRHGCHGRGRSGANAGHNNLVSYANLLRVDRQLGIRATVDVTGTRAAFVWDPVSNIHATSTYWTGIAQGYVADNHTVSWGLIDSGKQAFGIVNIKVWDYI